MPGDGLFGRADLAQHLGQQRPVGRMKSISDILAPS